MTKYKQKKLRGKHYIQVDEQILNWRRRRRKATKAAKTSHPFVVEQVASIRDALYNAPGCPTIDEQASPSPTTPYNMFEDV